MLDSVLADRRALAIFVMTLFQPIVLWVLKLVMTRVPEYKWQHGSYGISKLSELASFYPAILALRR